MLKVRGYVSSRKFLDNRVPQHVQNLVIRDYCSRKGLLFLLSAVEFSMRESFLTMEKVLSELSEVDGVVCYSLFQLPTQENRRNRIYSIVLEQKRTTHFAVESLMIEKEEDISRIENIWSVTSFLTEIIHPSLLQAYVD